MVRSEAFVTRDVGRYTIAGGEQDKISRHQLRGHDFGRCGLKHLIGWGGRARPCKVRLLSSPPGQVRPNAVLSRFRSLAAPYEVRMVQDKGGFKASMDFSDRYSWTKPTGHHDSNRHSMLIQSSRFPQDN